MTDIEISADYTDERAAWDQRMFNVMGVRSYQLADMSPERLRDKVERLAKAYADEVLAEREAKAVVGVPEGWKLVPLEPTDDMRFVTTHINNSLECEEVMDMLRAAIAAAPTPPSSPALPEQGMVQIGYATAKAAEIFQSKRPEYKTVIIYAKPVGRYEVPIYMPTPPAAKEQKEKQNG